MDYETDLERALKTSFPLDVWNVYPRRFLSLPGRRFRQILTATRDPRWAVTVRGFLPGLALALSRPEGRQIFLIHHLDHSQVPRRLASAGLERLLPRALRRADRLVVVADYWRRELSGLAPDLPVTMIPNGFDVDGYEISKEEVIGFRRRYGFDERPLVYLGTCHPAKGVAEAHRALAGAPYQLVTSGISQVELPCPNLELDHLEYRRLLAASDVVLAVSNFREGWNRTAHEALLAGTPVVGRDQGGLGELLRGSAQTLIDDVHQLPQAVANALAEREELADRGRDFVRSFTWERFASAWLNLIEEELAAGQA